MRALTTLSAAVFLGLAAMAARAQQPHQGHLPAATDSSASTEAYRAVNAAMHAGMDIAFTGDADVDFVRGMNPHHQGAIEMAKTVLKFGKDPEIRKLAEDIIRAQESEIAFMQAWLLAHGK